MWLGIMIMFCLFTYCHGKYVSFKIKIKGKLHADTSDVECASSFDFKEGDIEFISIDMNGVKKPCYCQLLHVNQTGNGMVTPTEYELQIQRHIIYNDIWETWYTITSTSSRRKKFAFSIDKANVHDAAVFAIYDDGSWHSINGMVALYPKGTERHNVFLRCSPSAFSETPTESTVHTPSISSTKVGVTSGPTKKPISSTKVGVTSGPTKKPITDSAFTSTAVVSGPTVFMRNNKVAETHFIIIGSAIGGVIALVIIIILLIVLFVKCRKQNKPQESHCEAADNANNVNDRNQISGVGRNIYEDAEFDETSQLTPRTNAQSATEYSLAEMPDRLLPHGSAGHQYATSALPEKTAAPEDKTNLPLDQLYAQPVKKTKAVSDGNRNIKASNEIEGGTVPLDQLYVQPVKKAKVTQNANRNTKRTEEPMEASNNPQLKHDGVANASGKQVGQSSTECEYVLEKENPNKQSNEETELANMYAQPVKKKKPTEELIDNAIYESS